MIKKYLEKLSQVSGVSGCEISASKLAYDLLKRYTSDVKIDNFGTVIGSIIVDKSLPTILLDAHIDEIGMIVTYIDDRGFLKVGRAGGLDRRVLQAQTVTVLGKEPIKGIVATTPPHLSKNDDKAIKEEDIFIDIGYSKEQAEKLVPLSSCVTVDGEFTPLLNGRYSGKSFDDRAGVTAILYALEIIKDLPKKFNIIINFSSQEELGCRGSVIGSYNANVDYAIAVDMSYGFTKGSKEQETGELGKGAMIGIAPSLDRVMFEQMKELAIKNNIPFQIEVMPRNTGTNADVISISRNGTHTALLSIPERNMHMPVEVVEENDIKSVSKLIAAYLGTVK